MQLCRCKFKDFDLSNIYCIFGAVNCKIFKHPNYGNEKKELGLEEKALNNVCVKSAAQQEVKQEGSMD
jgi:hypothetical protein